MTLRIRVIRAVEGGMSRTAAAKRFGVSPASAVRWMQSYRQTGRTQAKPCGGDRRSHRIEAQGRPAPACSPGDARPHPGRTPPTVCSPSGGSVSRSVPSTPFYRRHGFTFKKRPRMPGNRSAQM